ncbi:MAG: cobyrinate a,c-diamide synthase [Bradyrhizobium sp.]|uniref:cobyrinate a,c-diamide synthase n=1 Tax=Bradyrhizobium sp. TaxID=376 RepID=UPI0025BABD56|nr:cobyrinate a,c-diamide synthase [Bradyrhizobium sp.]MBI5263332.1 cobyrinate a,c-diamide synthase [Bradyrhizobium sp.]
MARLFISATHKSSGKTTVSIGLAGALAARGLSVQTFKKGPDYIDPMWLARASGRPCFNLDFNTQRETEILSTFRSRSRGSDIALVEGNLGLHDGVDIAGADSSAALARLLRTPVVLVVDTMGISRGIAPLVLGHTAFDRSIDIAGVILNKVGGARQETKIRQALERYADVPVLGAIGRDNALAVTERHLGLTTPAEDCDYDSKLAHMREVVARNVDLDRVIEIAAAAGSPAGPAVVDTPAAHDVRIAVARDAAFGFYYTDDFEALERAGAELVFIDLLHDVKLPPVDALYIGGGFPETQAAKLAANHSMRAQMRDAILDGLPTYAECGGLMYLTRSISFRGEVHEMVGVVPADTVVGDRPEGRGLVVLDETADAPWPFRPERASIPAHEFHYGALRNIDPACRFAYRMKRGYGVDGDHDGIVVHNLLASFSHLRDTSRHRWARRFVAFVRKAHSGARKPGAERGKLPPSGANAAYDCDFGEYR